MDFSELFARASLGEAVALAVSGGPDSMALALCAKRAGLSCRAFIVEHGLRPESAEEAVSVKKRLEALGIEAEILPWIHGSVQTKIHVEARKARYALLLDACRRHGLKTLFLAHHRDDQAETILMRLAKGSGVEGLSGMASVTERGGVRIVRPFLKVPKAELVVLCEAEGVAYVVDPSNEKEKYARGRLRRVQEALAQEGLTTERLLDLGERAGEAAEAVSFYAQVFLREKAELLSGGAIRLEAEAFAALPRAVGLKVLALCLAFIHRADYPPERRGLVRIYEEMDLSLQNKRDSRFRGNDAEEEKRKVRTLNGCLVQRTEKAILVLREFAAIADVQPIAPGQTVLWDGRWLVSLKENPSLRATDGSEAIQSQQKQDLISCDSGLPRAFGPRNDEEGLELRPLGFQPREVLDRLAPDLRRKVPQGRVRAALPTLWREGVLVAIPSFGSENKALALAELARSSLF